MGKIEALALEYKNTIAMPWQRTLSGAQRVMMVVYEKEYERWLRIRLGEFENATHASGHGWTLVDCTRWFAEWMAREEYKDSFFAEPELLGLKLEEDFPNHCIARLREALEAADETGVVAVMGVGSLYGFGSFRISTLIHRVEPFIRGRLLVFFPGTKVENNYRLLDARDGWNYLSQAITHHGQGGA